jgi:hypothetical protein
MGKRSIFYLSKYGHNTSEPAILNMDFYENSDRS